MARVCWGGLLASALCVHAGEGTAAPAAPPSESSSAPVPQPGEPAAVPPPPTPPVVAPQTAAPSPVIPPKRTFAPPRMVRLVGVATNTVQPSLSLGLDIARGNTQSSLFRGGLELCGQTSRVSWDWVTDFSYGQARDIRRGQTASQKTADNASTQFTVRRKYAEDWFAGFQGFALYDNLAGVDYRAVLGPGIGRILIDEDARQFSIEAGIAQVMESVDADARQWLALRLGQRFEQRLTSGALLRESMEWLPNPADTGDYFINADVSLEFAILPHLAFVATLRDRYVNRPADASRANDLIFSSSLRWYL